MKRLTSLVHALYCKLVLVGQSFNNDLYAVLTDSMFYALSNNTGLNDNVINSSLLVPDIVF